MHPHIFCPLKKFSFLFNPATVFVPASNVTQQPPSPVFANPRFDPSLFCYQSWSTPSCPHATHTSILLLNCDRIVSFNNFVLKNRSQILFEILFEIFISCCRIVSVGKAGRFIATDLNVKVKSLLPPRVAEMRMCVPYFLMMVSMNCWVVGLRPSKRTLRWNSGMSGTGFRIRSLLSIAVFLTFQRANSLWRTKEHLWTKPHQKKSVRQRDDRVTQLLLKCLL